MPETQPELNKESPSMKGIHNYVPLRGQNIQFSPNLEMIGPDSLNIVGIVRNKDNLK